MKLEFVKWFKLQEHKLYLMRTDFKITTAVVLFSMFMVQCSEPKATETVVVLEEIVTESVDSAAIISEDTTISYLEEEVLGLTQKNEEEQHTVNTLHSQVKILNKNNDSLKTVINQKEQVIKTLASSHQEKISRDELEIRGVVQDLNNAWVNLPGSENTDEFLSLFLPDFGVSMVSIDIDDKASDKMLNQDEFTQLLDNVRKTDGLTIQIGNVDFLYFDGRNDVYSIVYKAVLRSYQDEVANMDRSFSATITLKRVDGQFKIGKYSWVSMGHKLN